MNKKLILFFFILLSFVSKGQVYQSMPQWGYGPVKRFDIDSSLTIPTFSGLPSLRTTLTKKSAIAFDSTNNRFYFYNPKTATWNTTSGGSTDTTSLSNRIDLRVKYSDTASMLSPYLRSINQIDTNSLSNRINLKLSISDSSSMLNPYLRKIDTSNKWVSSVTKVNDSTIRVIKDGTTNDLVITTSSVVTSATRLITSVYNKSGATITKGSVIYIDGAHSSTLPSIALAKANAESTSAYTYGLVETDIPNNSQGTVIQNGTITNLNLPTSSYTDGQTLYLSPTIDGGYTTTKPLAPYHYVSIGTITRAHPNFGTIQIAIRNGFQLDELSDVKIALVPNDSTLLQFSRVDSLWHDVSPTTAIGNRYIKPSDTASMLTNYAKTSAVNLKVNISDTAAMLRSYTKQQDTIPMFVFGAGSGAAGDTSAFTTSAIYGAFYNDFSDTIILTSFRIGLQGTTPSINATIYFNDSLGITAGATKIVNAGNTATNIYTGTSVTSLDNTKIPPSNWVWVQTGTVTTKPTFFILTIFGYKSRR